jgi:dipeptidyl aminopeptidase/acylaminoacyl peptidase
MKEKKYTIDTLSKIPQIYAPIASHSKDKVAFYWDKTGKLELYTVDLKTNKIQQVSHGECPRAIRAGFVWTRDDENLIFAKDKDGDENHNLIKINIKSGKTESLTNTTGVQNYAADTSVDGKYLVIISTRKGGQLNLFRLDMKTKEVKQLTDHANPTWGGCSWNPKHDWIAYNVNETEDLRNMDIWLVKPDGSEKKKIVCVKEGSEDTVVEWNRDGRLLAFTTDGYEMKQPGVYNLETGKIKLLGGEIEETAAGFSEDGKKLVCLRNYDATVFPVIYEVKIGKCDETKFPEGLVSSVQYALNDQFLIAPLNTPTIPSALVAYDLKRETIKYLIEPQYGNADPEFFVTPERIRYKSSDGLEIPAILYQPKNIPKGKSLPTLIMPHGGPTGQYFFNFDIFGQILANEGYILLLPNIRGSTGYGRKFQDMNLMDWGGKDLEDVASGAEYLKSLPYVNKARIGIFGGSYGGYMTFIAVTKKPELWAAACAWVGISHLKTFYERSQPHFKYFIRMNMGDPEKNGKLWEDRSALNFAQNIKCPILMIHGVHDPRCPVQESRQFRDKLVELDKKEGKDFEYVEFGEEGHGAYTDMSMRTRDFKIILDFFNRKLK